MISHKHKCIFIHIPKTAGTSIEAALGHFDNWKKSKDNQNRNGQDHRSLRMLEKPRFQPNILSSPGNIVEIIRSIKHQTLKHTNPNNGLTVNAEQYRTYFKFSVVRNPWSRVFSGYCNIMRDKIHLNSTGITTDLTFNQFVSQHLDHYLLRPQTYWLKDFSGKINLDYICRFEVLNQDFLQICKILNLGDIVLPHTLKNSNQDYRQEYSSQSIEIVHQKYLEEIKIFNYTFEK